MIGNNTLELNEATVCKAIEFWLNRDQLGIERGVKVLSVDCKEENYCRLFQVSFEPMADHAPTP